MKYEPRPCERCSQIFQPGYGSRGRFCSLACFRNPVIKTCPHCGISFEVSVSKAVKYRYCSVACRVAHVQVDYECEQCGAAISRSKSQSAARFCSYECRYVSTRVDGVCAYCLRAYTVPRHRMTPNRRCCSNRCATLLRMREGFEPGWFGEKRRSGYRTDIEAMTEAVLIELGLRYLFEHKIGRFSVDFALPDLAVALECDGWHHALTTEGDRKRDLVISAKGWRVVRVPDKAIRADARRAIAGALDLVIS